VAWDIKWLSVRCGHLSLRFGRDNWDDGTRVGQTSTVNLGMKKSGSYSSAIEPVNVSSVTCFEEPWPELKADPNDETCFRGASSHYRIQSPPSFSVTLWTLAERMVTSVNQLWSAVVPPELRAQSNSMRQNAGLAPYLLLAPMYWRGGLHG